MSMRQLFLIAAMLLACASAHAGQWFYIDFANAPVGSQQECIRVPNGLDPIPAMQAVLGPIELTIQKDTTYPDGSRQIVVTGQGGNASTYATTATRCHEIRAEAHRAVAVYLAGQNKWYVAQYRGDCVELADSFASMNTPDQLHKVMTSHGAQLSLEKRGEDIALLIDDSGHSPPLVMVRGLARCQQSNAALIASQ